MKLRVTLFSGLLGLAVLLGSSTNAPAHQWSGWIKIPGGARTDVSVTPANWENVLYVFHKDPGGGIFYQTWDGNSWSPVTEVDGGGLTNASLGASSDGSNLYLFGKGINDGGQVWQNIKGWGTGWSGWHKVNSGWVKRIFTTDRGLAAATMPPVPGVSTEPTTFVFARRREDSGIYCNCKPLSGSWSGWIRIDPYFITAAPVGGPAVSATWNPSLNRLEVYAQGASDNGVYQAWRPPGGSWSCESWGYFHEIDGGGRTNATPAAAWDDSDRAVDNCHFCTPGHDTTHVFAKGIAYQGIYVNTYDNTHYPRSWSGWVEVSGGGTTDASPSVARYDQGATTPLYLFGKGGFPNNEIWFNVGN